MMKPTFEGVVLWVVVLALAVGLSFAAILYGSFRCNSFNSFDESGTPVVADEFN